MEKNKVAIVLVNYNGLQDTMECIESLTKLRDFDSATIYVVDNASKNDDLTFIKEKFSFINAIQSKENLGFAGGNNIAIRDAIEQNCDYVLLLNNDTIVDKEMLTNLLEAVDDNSIVAPSMYYYNEPDVMWYGGGKISKTTGNATHNNKDKVLSDSCDTIEDCTFATGCCILIPRNIIEIIGMLNEDYFMYCEDVEYCLRAIIAGFHIKYVPKAKLWHKVSKSTGGDSSSFSIYYMTRNRLKYITDYREYFHPIAYSYSVFSRYIRALQYLVRRNGHWKAFIKGIQDYRKRSFGKATRYE